MSDFTPTTRQVRSDYIQSLVTESGRNAPDHFGAEFDRWLADHDAEVRAITIHDTLTRARAVITQYLTTAEKWRYDTVQWAFAVMFGEIPEDTPAPLPKTDWGGGQS